MKRDKPPFRENFPHLGIMDTYSPGRLAMNTAALADVDSLPRTPASDVKKLGWRGVMRNVARDGRVVVTNHAQPEAVILSVAEYQTMLAALRSKAERDQHALERLRHEFDQRLACLNAPDAGEKIDALFAQPLQLHGKVFTGKDY
ncbi:prevent-host-death protein [Lysobacteraceae bacterium NML71-0210]|nr:prevent-host-death protein [Xanthomonadaceae bacterium NML71-0210]